MLPEWITKSFHPKTAGFTAIRDEVRSNFYVASSKLRILPLGDSITYGTGSSDGNGFRGQLLNNLVADKNTVDMVGSQMAGTMADSDNEGHDGASVPDISAYADKALRKRPNVVLLYAGTDDMKSATSAASATSTIPTLIDKILTKCPDAALLVAKLIPSSDSAIQGRINSYNTALETIVSSRVASGKRIQIMHMDAVVAVGDLSDGTHPNNDAYKLMGDHFYGGVLYAQNQKWIQEPVAGESAHFQDFFL
ncbi:carbohydrate esterase family 3 protein [Cadophora sp. DSE1049]|nr:carbohydrate esterase family 3 protein [Cadophora sp. DSE1049]